MLGQLGSPICEEANAIRQAIIPIWNFIFFCHLWKTYPKHAYAVAASTATLSSGRLKLNVPFPLAVRVVTVVVTTSVPIPL